MNSLLLAGAVALGFTLTTTAKADEPFLSPKAAALRHDFRKVPTTDTSPNLVSGNYLGALAKTEFNRAKVVPGGTVTPNLVSGNFNSAASKAGGGSLSPQRFEIAPLVGKDKSAMTCEAGCTMACCAKK
jgi:hypothetical protein